MNLITNTNTLNTIFNNDLKKIRNPENYWQSGKIIYKEQKSKILISFSQSKKNQIFLNKKLSKNNFLIYDKNISQLKYFTQLFFWCNILEKDFKLNSSFYKKILLNNYYKNLYLAKKKVLFFLKFKISTKRITKRLNTNITKISTENLFKNQQRYNKTLLKFLLKKNLYFRIYKICLIQQKFKLFLFMFFIKAYVSKNLNKKIIYLFFNTQKKFLNPMSHTGPREITLKRAQKRIIRVNKRTNCIYFFTPNLKKKYIKILSKKNLYNNNILYTRYFLKWLFLRKKIKKKLTLN